MAGDDQSSIIYTALADMEMSVDEGDRPQTVAEADAAAAAATTAKAAAEDAAGGVPHRWKVVGMMALSFVLCNMVRGGAPGESRRESRMPVRAQPTAPSSPRRVHWWLLCVCTAGLCQHQPCSEASRVFHLQPLVCLHAVEPRSALLVQHTCSGSGSNTTRRLPPPPPHPPTHPPHPTTHTHTHTTTTTTTTTHPPTPPHPLSLPQDKVNMSVAVIPMAKELGWSAMERGLVSSSFFWGYSLTQIPAGWVSTRRACMGTWHLSQCCQRAAQHCT